MARALIQATLPHRKTAGNEFERRNGNFRLSLLAPARIGLPYGTVPRLLLAWITTEAVRTKSRELELGDSLSGFMRDLGLVPTGGRWGSIGRLKDQTKRLFASTVSTTYDDSVSHAELGYRLADRSMLWWDARAPNQAALWRSTVTLTEPLSRPGRGWPVVGPPGAARAAHRAALFVALVRACRRVVTPEYGHFQPPKRGDPYSCSRKPTNARPPAAW